MTETNRNDVQDAPRNQPSPSEQLPGDHERDAQPIDEDDEFEDENDTDDVDDDEDTDDANPEEKTTI